MRWLDDQVGVIADIMREAFAAGFREGAETTARGIEGHVRRLELQLAVAMPASVPMGLRSLAQVAHELGRDQVAVAAAWRRCGAQAVQAGGRS